MAQRTLLEGYLYNGTMYGPGKNVELPDDEQAKDFLARVDELEEVAKKRQELVAADALELLPSGHPYREMFATVSNQPEGVEGGDVEQKGDPELPPELRPDGYTVSGTGSPFPEEFKPGLQRSTSPTVTPPEQEEEEQAKPQKLAPEGMQQQSPEAAKQQAEQQKQQPAKSGG